MKFERINENQIRCILSSVDLSMRNLNLGELAYGTEKARNLFREMIQQASNEVGFEADDIPLMVEAIPLSNESVMLLITKIEDPEELDTRFSRFSPFTDEDQGNLWNGLSNELLEGADTLMELLKKDLLNLAANGNTAQTDAPLAQPTEQPEDAPAVLTRIYRFDSLDQVIDAAKITGNLCACQNTLYKKSGSSNYYLVMSNEGVDELSFSRLCNVLAEYGEKIRQETASEAYFQEHYEAIIKEQALQKLMGI